MDAPRLDSPTAPLPDWLKRIGMGLGDVMTLPNEKRVFVSDGGFADNQGVVPLLNRRCVSILAIDATSDDAAEFATWASLSERTYLSDSLLDLGIALDLSPLRDARVKSGWKLPAHVVTTTAVNKSTGGITKLDILKLGIDGEHLSRYPKVIQDFASKQWGNDWDASPACRGVGLKRRCAFPLESTGRQSFTIAEFRAYRCLGKFMVDEWMRSRRSVYETMKDMPVPLECQGDVVLVLPPEQRAN